MKGTISGKRVYLRSLERADIDRGWHDWINDFAVNQHLTGLFPISRDALVRYFEASQPPHAMMFAICLVENDEYIGNAKLSEINPIARHCRYGRIIGKAEHRGHGLGSEALLLLFTYGFRTLGMNKMYTGVLAGNEASSTSNSRIGVQQEGIWRQHAFKDGEFRDIVLLSMLRSEFEQRYGSDAGPAGIGPRR